MQMYVYAYNKNYSYNSFYLAGLHLMCVKLQQSSCKQAFAILSVHLLQHILNLLDNFNIY